MSPEPCDFTAAIRRFSGFASNYNTYRPSPPSALLEMLSQTAHVERPKRVVDLGCGTGLSTRAWAERAEEVIGIDPTEDMRNEAIAQTSASNVTYRAGFSHDTGLEDDSTDIVTCSSSVHLMEPVSTLAEVARILRPGGVFAAYGHGHAVFPAWEMNQIYQKFCDGIADMKAEAEKAEGLNRWPPEQITDRMRESGLFRYTNHLCFHLALTETAEEFVSGVLTHGSVMTLIRTGHSEEELGIDRLREGARRVLGDKANPCYFVYWVRLGVV